MKFKVILLGFAWAGSLGLLNANSARADVYATVGSWVPLSYCGGSISITTEPRILHLSEDAVIVAFRDVEFCSHFDIIQKDGKRVAYKPAKVNTGKESYTEISVPRRFDGGTFELTQLKAKLYGQGKLVYIHLDYTNTPGRRKTPGGGDHSAHPKRGGGSGSGW